ncbi:hypothetical protein [Paramicrobacterium agarici]|uniref:hypothetical protein n=1 Tax=Paramicrobacterium agarici TaxID=630514 RepID=UPI0011537904|nr:hypothetical protein [Microbacterium agarici]TQO23779.1 hypothetical protein FB385_2640 [Microbacterium agarici]
MAFDTPIMIGGGAEHSPEVFRAQTYAATNGAEGVVSIGDLKVAQMDVPGTNVVVRPGSGLVLNRYPGHAGETYTIRLGAQMLVPIAATGSGAGRSDLIVARVEDSSVDPRFDPPADPTTATYVFPRVISNVDANVTRLQDVPGHEADTAITLARIDIPASSEVSGATIVDLREVAIPLEKSGKHMGFPPADEPIPSNNYSSWPKDVGVEVKVPEWATRAFVTASLSGIEVGTSAARTVAGLRTYVGPRIQPPDASKGVELGENGILVDEGGTTTPRRPHLTVVGEHDVSKYAGQRVWLMTQALRTDGTASVVADYQTTAVIEWTFSQVS